MQHDLSMPVTAADVIALNPLFLDVRTADEYAKGHIHGAMHINVDQLLDKVGEEIPNKNQTLVVYCQTARRSEHATEVLRKMGYSRVFDLGSIESWTGKLSCEDGSIFYNYFGTLPSNLLEPFRHNTFRDIGKGIEIVATLEGMVEHRYSLNLNNNTYRLGGSTVMSSKLTLSRVGTDLRQEFPIHNAANTLVGTCGS
jgi:phage shock protein E